MHPLLSKALMGVMFASVLLADAQPQDIQTMLRDWSARDQQPRVLAAYMPWFGDPQHIDVGYSSHDPAILRRQIDEASGMGISGFAVDWNGPSHDYTDRTLALIEQLAGEKHFQIALLYNETENTNGTDQTISDFDYAHKNYIGPDAPWRDAYLTYNGRPVIFIFPKGGHTDWERVRQAVNGWAAPPVLLYKDDSAKFADAFDGFFVWVHPGKGGWLSDGSDWGEQHLEDFYKRMKNKYPGKILVAGAWPAFDDSRARWGLNRFMDARCGKTLEETLRLAREFTAPNPQPFLLVQTWNDYEEGTAIERRSFENCEKH